MEADNNVIQSLSREQDESRDIINSLLTTIDEQNVLIEDYVETIIVLTHQVEDHHARDAERERIEREGIDYEYPYSPDPDEVEICDRLLVDISCARAYLAPDATISYRIVGSVVWVSAS